MVYVCQPEPPFRNFVPGPVIYFGNKEESARESREEEIVTLKNSCLKKREVFFASYENCIYGESQISRSVLRRVKRKKKMVEFFLVKNWSGR